MHCVTPQPGPDWVCTTGGGWVPPSHPQAEHREAPPQNNDFAPPREDEYEDVETYPGSGERQRVLVRTADPETWFEDGKTYRHPYGFVIRVEGIAPVRMEGRLRWCSRLVLIESPGDPEVGRVLYARLFAPKHVWEAVQP